MATNHIDACIEMLKEHPQSELTKYLTTIHTRLTYYILTDEDEVWKQDEELTEAMMLLGDLIRASQKVVES